MVQEGQMCQQIVLKDPRILQQKAVLAQGQINIGVRRYLLRNVPTAISHENGRPNRSPPLHRAVSE